jgi:hypothetical protein
MHSPDRLPAAGILRPICGSAEPLAAQYASTSSSRISTTAPVERVSSCVRRMTALITLFGSCANCTISFCAAMMRAYSPALSAAIGAMTVALRASDVLPVYERSLDMCCRMAPCRARKRPYPYSSDTPRTDQRQDNRAPMQTVREQFASKRKIASMKNAAAIDRDGVLRVFNSMRTPCLSRDGGRHRHGLGVLHEFFKPRIGFGQHVQDRFAGALAVAFLGQHHQARRDRDTHNSENPDKPLTSFRTRLTVRCCYGSCCDCECYVLQQDEGSD